MAVLRVHHLAVVVPEINEALAFWSEMLGLELEHQEEVPAQETLVAMLPIGDTEVELVQPTTDTSGMARYMEKRGPGLHHICFEVDDIDSMLAKLKDNDIRLINEEPVVGAGGKRVAFIHPKSANGVLVELVESQTVI